MQTTNQGIKEDLSSLSSQDNEMKILRWDRSVETDLIYWYWQQSATTKEERETEDKAEPASQDQADEWDHQEENIRE